MIYKKFFAFILSLVMITSLSACGKDTPDTPSDINTSTSEKSTDNVIQDETTSSTTEADDTSSTTTTQPSVTDKSEEPTVPANAPTQKPDSPADWTKAQIVEAYKAAARKTHSSVKSQHRIEMKEVLVNGKEIGFVVPIMSAFLKSNETDKDGITGGYDKLTAADVASARAYKNGSSLIIEMTMNKQTSGASEDANSGCVGHAITTVGDIGTVAKQLEDKLPLELNDKETRIYYTNPTVKVVIDPNGKIVNGTWQYTVDIRLNNYKAFGQPVDSTSVVMKNTLTVNGGFKKM
ncbi:MAG: hypothetical protein IJN78_03460 [Clostridia bacterium]|nr:hypothetical protein [Clostridia bacterium]